MKFSLTYPEYRLLDIKALSEFHMACVATDLDFVSDQSLLSLSDTKMRSLEETIFRRFCELFYKISRLVDLELFWELFHTITHLGEVPHKINNSNFVLHYSIDLDDFLLMFTRFVDIAYGEHGELLYDALSKMDLKKHYTSDDAILNEIFDLIAKLDSIQNNGVLAVLNAQQIQAELENNSLSYFFREIFFALKPSVEDAKTIAYAAMTDVKNYIQKSLIESYAKIWFEGETVLSVYADLPSLREGLVAQAKKVMPNGTQVTYDMLRPKYIQSVRRLTFSQDNNLTAVYEKYIAAQVIHSMHAHSIFNIEEQTSMFVSQSSDGKACTTIDKPLNKTAALKHNTAPRPTLEPATLLAEIYALESKTEKKKVRSKPNVLEQPQLIGDYAYTTTAIKKYPILSKLDTGDLCWQYSKHGMYNKAAEAQGIITERQLPMYHCVHDILAPELVAKQQSLVDVWSKICAQYKYNRQCSFNVQFADKEYLSHIIADPSSRVAVINTVRPYVQYVMAGTFKSDNWLYEAWRLSKVNIQNNEVVSSATLEDFNAAIEKLQQGVDTGGILSEENIQRLSSFKRVVNEIYRLDASLKADGYSFSKLWAVYLADNFLRESNPTKAVFNATEYIDNLLELPTGYHPSTTRYSATIYAKNRSGVTCKTTTLSGMANALSKNTEGKRESVFTTLRQQVCDSKYNIVSPSDPGVLETTPLQEISEFINNIANAFVCNLNVIEMSDRFLKKAELSEYTYIVDDLSAQNCMRQGLQLLVDFKLGDWSGGIRDISHFQPTSQITPSMCSTASMASNITNLLNKEISKNVEEIHSNQTEWESLIKLLQFPFLLISLLYTMPIEEYYTYRKLLAQMGVPVAFSGNSISDYEATIGKELSRLQTLCLYSAVIISQYDNENGVALYTKARSKYLEVLLSFKAVLTVLGTETSAVLHVIQNRFTDTSNILNALSSELNKCDYHFRMISAACHIASNDNNFRSTSLVIALNSFGAFSETALNRLDISSCTTQTATEDDLAMLFDMDISDSSDYSESTTEYKAVEFLQNFIDNRGRILEILNRDNFNSLSECPYFVYMFGYLIHYMFKSASLKPQLHSVLQDKIYFETDYRPYAVVNTETSDICSSIYGNLVYLLDNNINGIAKILSIPGNSLSSNMSIYNIATYGKSNYSRDMFDFISYATADNHHSAGMVFEYCRPTEDSPLVPYYLHVSGLYICGIKFDKENMSDVALYYSADDINYLT